MTTRYHLAILPAAYFAENVRPKTAQQRQEGFNPTQCGGLPLDYHLPTWIIGCLRQADMNENGGARIWDRSGSRLLGSDDFFGRQ